MIFFILLMILITPLSHGTVVVEQPEVSSLTFAANISLFNQLQDTPNSKSGSAGKCVVVGSSNSLEYQDCIRNNLIVENVDASLTEANSVKSFQCATTKDYLEFTQQGSLPSPEGYLSFEGNIETDANHGRIVTKNATIRKIMVQAYCNTCVGNFTLFVNGASSGTIIDLPTQPTCLISPVATIEDVNVEVDAGDVLTFYSAITEPCGNVASDTIITTIYERRCD